MPYRDMNYLVVEDDAFQRKILIDILQSLGVDSILQAVNGQEALKIIEDASNAIDVVLSDLKMPEMDGMAFLRHLGEGLHRVEVLIISGVDKKLLTAVNKVSKLYNIKLVGTIEKPINAQQIKTALSRISKAKYQSDTKTNLATNHVFSIEEIQEGVRQHQFKPYLQPKVDLKTGQIVGAEALARWIHPKHGVLLPYTFIPTLEDQRKIDELTFSILRESALVSKTLIEKGYPINIAVNLSLASLSDTSMADQITDIVANAGVSPQYITLEITESAAMTDAPYALENLIRLHMNGFTLSIDDYGTGYSNLQQLTRIAFGELKIDQSFVQSFSESDAMLVVVASSIDMAHKLNIKSVAEGIEKKEDWELLAKMGCDIGQGFFIAKPMDTEAFYQYVDQHKATPIPATPASVQVNSQSKLKAAEDCHILIVDDQVNTRRALQQSLFGLGYQSTQTASSFSQALEALEKTKYDIIIIDVFMEGMSGLNFIKQIRTGKTVVDADIRIIIISNLTQSTVLGPALALDVNGIVVKPVIPDTVDKKIRHALSRETRLHPKIAYESINTADIIIETTVTNPQDTEEDVSNNSAYYVPIHALTIGMIVRKAVYSNNDELILEAGEVLTGDIINRLMESHDKLKSKDFLVEKPES